MSFTAFSLQVSEPAGAPAPASPAAGEGAPPAQGPPPGAMGGSWIMFVMLFGVLALIMWQNRSQQKKQAATVAALKKGDRIATQSGLIGRLMDKDERYAKVEIASGVVVDVLLTSVLGRDAGPGTGVQKKESDKKDSK